MASIKLLLMRSNTITKLSFQVISLHKYSSIDYCSFIYYGAVFYMCYFTRYNSIMILIFTSTYIQDMTSVRDTQAVSIQVWSDHATLIAPTVRCVK